MKILQSYQKKNPKAQQLLDQIFQQKDMDGNGLLHTAAQYANSTDFKTIAEFCKECGYSLDIPNFNNDTPVHITAREGSIAKTEYLLKQCQVNPNVKNNNNKKPINLATKNSPLHIMMKPYCPSTVSRFFTNINPFNKK